MISDSSTSATVEGCSQSAPEVRMARTWKFNRVAVSTCLFAIRWRFTKRSACFFHRRFEVRPGLLPGFLGQRHCTCALAITGIFSWFLTAASLASTGVLPLAGVSFSRGAATHARTVVVITFTLSLTGIQSTTDMWFLEQLAFFFLARQSLMKQRRTTDHATKRSHRQLVEVASC